MEENNILNNQPEEINDRPAVTESQPEVTQIQPEAEQIQPESEPVANVGDNEIDLDPEISGYIDELGISVEEKNDYIPPQAENQNQTENSDFTPKKEYYIPDPLPPVMPRIDKKPYQPADTSGSSKGLKVFALVVAFMIVAATCVTGGYFFGKSSGSAVVSETDAPKVDLAQKPEVEDAKTVSQIYSEVSPSVVGIYVYTDEGIQGSATGVVYSEDGYIITNDHIYDDIPGAKFKIYTSDKKEYDAKFVAGDQRSDLAVLKVTGSNSFTVPEFGNSAELVQGETVVAIGCYNGADLAANVSEGVVSDTSARVSITTSYTGKYIQTDSVINPGSSGGALCNIYGQIVGITSAKIVASEYDGIGFAIPTTTVKTIVDSLIQYKEVKGRARLGISYTEVDGLTAEITGEPRGLKIAEIDEESDLYGKSVEAGDYIVAINGKTVKSSDAVLDIIESSKPGSTISLKIKKGDNTSEELDITVKLLEDESTSSYEKSASSSDNSQFNPDYENDQGIEY